MNGDTQTASQRAMADVDKAAEAIWRTAYPNDALCRSWLDVINKTHFRAMAVAAIDALGLTEEWRTTGWLSPVPESLARKQAESEGTLQHRPVGPWQPDNS